MQKVLNGPTLNCEIANDSIENYYEGVHAIRDSEGELPPVFDQQPPSRVKTSNTVLLYKKGDKNDIRNWRPIAMGDTTPKLYAAIMAGNITSWSISNGRLSASQKGFLNYEGCFFASCLLAI